MKRKDDNVDLEGMNPAMWPMALRVDKVCRNELGYELIITSAGEDSAKHSAGSFHYRRNTPERLGRAIDMRTWTTYTSGVQLSGIVRERFYEQIKRAAGKAFQAIDEKDHIHIELDSN